MSDADQTPGVDRDTLAAPLERACEVMHDAYERAAVGAGWETQTASRKPWADVPEANKATMRAAVAALLTHLNAHTPPAPTTSPDGLRERIEALCYDAEKSPWDPGMVRSSALRAALAAPARDAAEGDQT